MESAALASTGPARVMARFALMVEVPAWSQGVASSQAPALTAECRLCHRHRKDVELVCLWIPLLQAPASF